MARPLQWETPEAMRDAAAAYFHVCQENGVHPTVTGLALALDADLTRQESVDTIKRAKLRVEAAIKHTLSNCKLRLVQSST